VRFPHWKHRQTAAADGGNMCGGDGFYNSLHAVSDTAHEDGVFMPRPVRKFRAQGFLKKPLAEFKR
jgi:hypothetical protein